MVRCTNAARRYVPPFLGKVLPLPGESFSTVTPYEKISEHEAKTSKMEGDIPCSVDK